MKITSLFFLAVCGLGAWSRLLEAPGDPDPFFGTGGVVKTKVGEAS